MGKSDLQKLDLRSGGGAMDTRRFLLGRIIPATALILILILASSYAAAQTSPAVSDTAGAIVLAQADADEKMGPKTFLLFQAESSQTSNSEKTNSC